MKIPKPKYKIGDLIVYPNRYQDKDDSLLEFYQGVIIESNCLWESNVRKDKPCWYYNTKQTIENEEDTLIDNDILYKLI